MEESLVREILAELRRFAAKAKTEADKKSCPCGCETEDVAYARGQYDAYQTAIRTLLLPFPAGWDKQD